MKLSKKNLKEVQIEIVYLLKNQKENQVRIVMAQRKV